MKKNLFAVFLLVVGASLNAQVIQYAYPVHAFGVGNSIFSTARSVAEDANGNTYITGSYTGTIDLDLTNGNDNHTNSSVYSNPYLVKLDAAGNYVWGRTFDCNDLGEIYDLALDGSGNVYMTGQWSGIMDFDPGASTVNVQSQEQDLFTIKLNPSGNLVWYKTVGKNQNLVEGHSIAVSANSVTIGGYVYGFAPPINFNPGGTNTNSNFSEEDGFVLTYDLNGNFMRVMIVSNNATGTNGVEGVTYDAAGNLFAVGHFSNGFSTPTNGRPYGFLAKYNSGGTLTWVKTFNSSSGSTDGVYNRAVAVDATGNIYVGTAFAGTADMNPGAATLNFTSNSVYAGTDSGILKLDANGGMIWAKRFDGEDQDFVRDIGVDANGSVYVVGSYSWETNFNPSGTPHIASCTGYTDSYLVKFSAIGNYQTSLVHHCTLDNNGYGVYLSGSGNFYYVGSFGVDSNFDLLGGNYTVTLPDQNENRGFVAKYCINPQTPSSNTPTPNLTICAGATTTVSVTSQPGISYTWYNNATGGSVITTGASYTTNPLSSNITFYVQASNGCGSSATRLPISITVHPNPSNGINTTTGTMTAQQAGATYQWLSCPQMTAIPGATSQSYSPPATGNFAVRVTLNGCTATSQCIQFNPTGIDHQFQNGITIDALPIPANQFLTLRFSSPLAEEATIQVFNLQGAELMAKNLAPSESSVTLNIEPLSSGIYFVKVSLAQESKVIKFMK